MDDPWTTADSITTGCTITANWIITDWMSIDCPVTVVYLHFDIAITLQYFKYESAMNLLLYLL